MSATTAQRNQIRWLIHKVELDPKTLTLLYRRFGVSDAWIGRPVDSYLDAISVEDASALITKLKAAAPDDDGDDD